MKNFSVKATGLGAKDAPLKKYNEIIKGHAGPVESEERAGTHLQAAEN